MKFLKRICLVLVVVLPLISLSASSLAETLGITGPNTMKASASVKKSNTAYNASVNLSSWEHCHEDIQVWAYKDHTGRATHIYVYESTGNKSLMYLAGMIEKDADYHLVWNTNPDVPKNITAYVTFTWTP